MPSARRADATRASAQKRLGAIDRRPTAHFAAAQLAIHQAWIELGDSERADEDIWHDDAGHAATAMQTVELAVRAIDGAASWRETPSTVPGGPWFSIEAPVEPFVRTLVHGRPNP